MKKPTLYRLVERAFSTKEERPPEGFELVQSLGNGFERSDSVKLMLPRALAADLTRPEPVKVGEGDSDEEEEAAEEGTRSSSRSAGSGASEVALGALAALAFKRRTLEEKLLDALTAQGGTAPALPAQYADACSTLVPIYALGEPVKLLAQRSKSGDNGLRRRNDELIEQFKLLGNQRHLLRPFHTAQPDSGQARAMQAAARAFGLLREHHPHFRAVIDLFEAAAKASVLNGCPMRPPPVLMLGAPGIGKTHFAQDLARMLGMPLHRVAYDSGVTNSELMGSAQYWGNTHPGRLFDALCLGAIANPLFILEEIDKAADHSNGHGSGRNALNALHTLLEPSSSGSVTDLSTGMIFDASHVLWLATANEAAGIMPTILSRFTVFRILPPVGEDAWRVATHLAKSVTGRLGCDKPARAILTALAVLSPREQRKALEQACAQATAAGRRAVQAADFPAGLLDEELADARPAAVGKALRWLH